MGFRAPIAGPSARRALSQFDREETDRRSLLAAVTGILSALARVTKRDGQTLLSVTLNNFFLVAVLLAYGALASRMAPLASMPFFLIVGAFLLFPASNDPWNKMPATALTLWPLTSTQRAALRVASFAFSPIAWLGLLILIVLRTKAALAFLFLMFVVRGLAFLGAGIRSRWAYFYPPRLVPPLPTNLGRLIVLNLRQMSCLLDFYLATAISVVGTGYRLLSSRADPAAFPILAILVGLAFSTYAQSVFGFEGPAGLTRYRLVPLAGWRVLLAKDAAFMAALSLLTLPLSLATGLTFGLVALAVGRYPSLRLLRIQQKWRFTSGEIRFGAAQIFLASGIAAAESQEGLRWLGIAFLAYAISLLAGGWYWDSKKPWQ